MLPLNSTVIGSPPVKLFNTDALPMFRKGAMPERAADQSRKLSHLDGANLLGGIRCANHGWFGAV